jgi:hypothetical protein
MAKYQFIEHVQQIADVLPWMCCIDREYPVMLTGFKECFRAREEGRGPG